MDAFELLLVIALACAAAYFSWDTLHFLIKGD